jgi:lactoylglutathione lyase
MAVRGTWAQSEFMHVEKLKYLIWAQDMARAVRFYQDVFDAEVVRQSDIMAELTIADGTLGIHSGGEGKRTWTGLAFQVGDLFGACDLILANGGSVLRPPEDTPEEPAHLAMCADPEGNEIMLTKARHR